MLPVHTSRMRNAPVASCCPVTGTVCDCAAVAARATSPSLLRAVRSGDVVGGALHPHDDDAHVVLRPAGDGLGDELLDDLIGVGAAGDQLADAGVEQFAGEAVGAHEEALAG